MWLLFLKLVFAFRAYRFETKTNTLFKESAGLFYQIASTRFSSTGMNSTLLFWNNFLRVSTVSVVVYENHQLLLILKENIFSCIVKSTSSDEKRIESNFLTS